MENCRICGNNLYENITFYNMFRLDYKYHVECYDKLKFNCEEEIFPIESNVIIYDYIFEYLPKDYNKDFLEFSYLINLLNKQLLNRKWSIVIYVDDKVKDYFNNYNPYLILNLTKRPILLISTFKKNIKLFEKF